MCSTSFRGLFVTLTISTFAAIAGYYFFTKKKRALKWQHVGEVKSLMIYPLKSARRVELDAAECIPFGLRAVDECNFKLFDRCLSIYKESAQETVTSHKYPKILLIEVRSVQKNVLTLDAPGMDTLTLTIPTPVSGNENCKIRTFIGTTWLVDCGDDASEWISTYVLETLVGLRLGFCDQKPEKEIGCKSFLEIFPMFELTKHEIKCDVSNYLLLNESSIEDLMQKIPNSGVTINNFRPNVVVSGSELEPYAEDHWKWLKIGNAIFSVTKPCVRCSITTINPDSIVRAKRNEPLRTLKKYRKLKHISNVKFETEQVVMGMYFNLFSGGGMINVRDKVFVGRDSSLE